MHAKQNEKISHYFPLVRSCCSPSPHLALHPRHFSTTALWWHCWVPALCHIPLQSWTWQQQRIFLKWIQLVSIASTHSHAKSPKVSSVTDNFLKIWTPWQSQEPWQNLTALAKIYSMELSFFNDHFFFLFFPVWKHRNIPMLSYLEWKSSLSRSFGYRCHF